MKKVEIDSSKCIGDRVCVDTCPNNVLDLVDGVAKVINSENCETCGACEVVCPQRAIKIIEVEK